MYFYLIKYYHDSNHSIIDFNKYNDICFIHKEKFNSYCKNCKINLCMECESEHKDKQNLVYFRDILPNKNKFKENLNELKTKIEEYKEKINEVKKALDSIIINLENYYEINDNLIKDFDKKKKNYYLFKNINELDKNNSIIIKEINNTIKTDGFIDLINNSINIMNKMDIKFKGKNILQKNQQKLNEVKEKSKKEEIIELKYPVNIKEYNLDSQFNFSKINDCFLNCPLIGLDNIGANCFMNATLQCLCHIPEFVNDFKYNKEFIPKIRNDITYGNILLSSSFKLLVEKLWPDRLMANYKNKSSNQIGNFWHNKLNKTNESYAPYDNKKKYLI